MQIFLTLCTLVTIYFADEVPLSAEQGHHSDRPLDKAPLLDDRQQNGIELSKSKFDLAAQVSHNGKNFDNDRERNMNSKNANLVEDRNESSSDGPGAVLVNLLTSLRHLPPGMHSVLVVMALTWVSAVSFVYLLFLKLCDTF